MGNAVENALGMVPIVGSVIQGIVDANTARRNVDLTNEANLRLANYAYSKDLEMWNRGNEYNSPQAQMARLKAAGLNPNLVYGNGAVGNSSSSLPHFQAPQMEYNYIPPVDLTRTMGHFQNFRINNAKYDNMRELRKTLSQTWQGKAIANQFARETKYDRAFRLKMEAMKADYERLHSKNRNTREVYSWQYQADMLREKARQMHLQSDKIIQDIARSKTEQGLTKKKSDFFNWGSYGNMAGGAVRTIGNLLRKGRAGKASLQVPATKARISTSDLMNRAKQWERRFDKP